MTSSPTPGYIDVQVNGYAGVDFNQDALSSEDFHRACEALAAAGVASFLPTIVTEHLDKMAARLARLVELRVQDDLARQLITAVHIEGPFLSPLDGYRGAHPADAIQPADVDAMKRLLDAAGGLTRIVTLAPECDPGLATTRMLVREGITVSAGHCDPTLEQLDAAIDVGLAMFTHLGNGCPRQMDRHDNIVQRALSRAAKLRLGFIADGVHVPLVALGNYLRLAGLERCFVVTDAMAAAGLGAGVHRLGRWEVEVGEDLVAWAPGKAHLVGSAMTMPQAAANLRQGLGLTPPQILQLTRDNPADAIGLTIAAA
ncbi:MAG: hypothetical protein WD009_06290 [Phycisphaeraceae bacterium]